MDGYAVPHVDEIGGRQTTAVRQMRRRCDTTSASRRSVSTLGQPVRRALGSSTSTTSPSPIPKRSCISCDAGAHPSRSTVISSPRRLDVRVCAARRQTHGVRQGARHYYHRGRWCSRKAVRAWRLGAFSNPAATLRGGQLRRGGGSRARVACGRSAARHSLDNVACCESLAGKKDEAIAHLRRAIELSDRSRSSRQAILIFIPSARTPPLRNCSGRDEVHPIAAHVPGVCIGSHPPGGEPMARPPDSPPPDDRAFRSGPHPGRQ